MARITGLTTGTRQHFGFFEEKLSAITMLWEKELLRAGM
jgi:hypothetical protein